jgi:5-formyltetrahydrofolate cyclo-ligase
MTHESKKALRAAIFLQLMGLNAVARAEKGAAAVKRLVESPEFARAGTMLLYDSFGTEVSTHELMALCLAGGKVLCLPRTSRATRAMTPHVVRDLDVDLEPTRLGFREPAAECPTVPVEQLDLVLTPGLGFDLHGNRLGRGVGYYDRFLAQSQLKAALCALAFECQIVPEIPHDRHDKPVQVVFTEDRVIRP